MSFKTIFFDYMTLWTANEANKQIIEIEEEKVQFIKDIEEITSIILSD